MARSPVTRAKPRVRWSLGLILVSCLLAVTQLAFVDTASAATTAADDFNRADGSLGPNWSDISDGGLVISSQVVTGTVGQVSGDIWSAQAFGSDQYSQDEVTSAQLTGGQWVGPGVRLQNGGQNGYVGFYYWNFGSPELMLFKRSGGGWAEIGGGAYPVSPLAAGAKIQVTAVGSKISLLLNGTAVISVTDTSFTGGSPGIVSYGNPTADNWSGGSAGAANFTVGGTVSGLSGTVVLQDNGGDNLSVGANGSFTFATALAAGAAYSVTVKTNPTGQTCAVANGSGAIGSANITNVAVTCTNTGGGGTFTVGGAVSGLSGTVVLQDNGGDNLSVGANGSFTFATALAAGAAYSVTVKTNPTGQTCAVANGSGTIGSANITNVAVTCGTGSTGTTASDDFNRADGSLGPNWSDISDGGLVISSQVVTGTVGRGVG